MTSASAGEFALRIMVYGPYQADSDKVLADF